jgi:hypothetical protein
MADSPVFQLKITLSGSKPTIWRRIQVASQASLGKLHEVIQIAMGWKNSHMHLFDKGGVQYGSSKAPDMDFKDEKKVKLDEIFAKPKDKIRYEYDFGDSWAHDIVLEKVLEKVAKTPVCIEGEMACPPEDCGGLPGFYDLLETLKDPDDEEAEDILDWIGEDFDPAKFSLAAVNAELKAVKGA